MSRLQVLREVENTGVVAVIRMKEADKLRGVIDALLGGSVSPETRQVLESGSNPLLARADTAGAARRGARIELTGVDQLVGLALGSPEFQRR